MITQYSELANKYVKQWQCSEILDKRLEKFSIEFESWFNQFSDEVKPVVLKLLDNFYYYSHMETNRLLNQLHNRLVSYHSVSDEDSIYMYIKSDDGISNSSNDYWTEYKILNDINRNICYENSEKIPDIAWEYISNIVFIDDCCGTGNSFITELSKNILRYKNKYIYFIVIHIMDEARIKLQDFAKENDLIIIPISSTIQQKAFSNEYFNDEQNSAKQIIYNVSKTFKIPKKSILGYEESESLMAFYNNTPNNTLGIIRYDVSGKYKSIFPRNNNRKPNWQTLKQDDKERKIKNYNSVVRGCLE